MLAFVLTLGTTSLLTAQTFNANGSFNDIYPTGGSGALFRPETNSSYSMANITFSAVNTDMYLSGWSGRGTTGSGFCWRFTGSGNPSFIVGQATVPYPGCYDIEVGFVDSPGARQILVAYYRTGIGHFLDVYNVGTASVNYSYTMALSNSGIYGRISMDCHLTYGVAIVWENPSNARIEAIGGINGVWGPVVSMPGSASGFADVAPDVAFSHSNGPLNVHMVWFTPNVNELVESVLSWPDLVAGSTASYLIEDINAVGTPLVDLRPVIDCPDHYSNENWAYAYTLDDNRIDVRLIDYNTLATPITVSPNDGSLSNVPTMGAYRNKMPCLSHEFNPAEINVAWYATDGSQHFYIGLRMPESGFGIFSMPDYTVLPSSATPFAYPGAPGISFSKMTDLNPAYAYVSYYDNLLGGYQLHHAYIPWGTFKGRINPRDTYHPECGRHTPDLLATLAANVQVSPNPFHDVVTAAYTADRDGIVTLQLTDLTGKIMAQTGSEVKKGRHNFTTDGKNLPVGIYLLHISMDGQLIGRQKVVKQ